jgi:tetratricopeptide (TPR) repeat protein
MNKRKVSSNKVSTNSKLQLRILLALLLASVLIIYAQSINFGFVNFDDDRYVQANEHIDSFSGENITYWFTEYFDGHYHPLTLASLTLDNILGGGEAKSFHLMNMLLHMASVLVLFFLMKRLFSDIKTAFFIALIFAVHPLQIESVAWVSERKNLLFGVFFLLSLFQYKLYLEKPNSKNLWLSILFFALSLLSKVTALSLFFTLFALDYFTKQDFKNKRLWLIKLPYLILSVVFIFIATQAQHTTWEESNLAYTFVDRIFLASRAFVFYAAQSMLPHGLSAYYPYPVDVGLPLSWVHYFMPVIVLGFLALLVFSLKKNHRILSFGLLFFALNIALLVKLFDIPHGNYNMADRYAYIPSIGIFVIIVVLLYDKFKGNKGQKATIILSIYALFLMVYSYQRVDIWENSKKLWTDVIKSYPNYSHAYNMRGLGKLSENDVQGAMQDFGNVVRLNPDNLGALLNLAQMNIQRGDYQASIDYFSQAIMQSDTLSTAWMYRGIAYQQLKNNESALQDLSKALELNPQLELAYFNRAVLYFGLKNYPDALKDLDHLIRINPSINRAYYLRGKIYFAMQQLVKGCEDMKQALQMGIEAAQEEINKHCP